MMCSLHCACTLVQSQMFVVVGENLCYPHAHPVAVPLHSRIMCLRSLIKSILLSMCVPHS